SIPAGTSHSLFRFPRDVGEFGRLLEFHITDPSRVPEADQPLGGTGNRTVQQDVRIAHHAVREEAAVRDDLVPLLADLQDALVVFRPLVIPELASLRDGRPHVTGLEVPEGSDVPSVLRVLVAQQPRPPPGVVAFPTLPLRDRGDIDHGAFPAECRDRDVRAEELLRVLDPVLDGTSADAVLHEVRLLLRYSREEAWLRVRDETNIVHLCRLDLLPCLLDVVLLRDREDVSEPLASLGAPGIPDAPHAFPRAAVQCRHR